jgi:hypothetical protein
MFFAIFFSLSFHPHTPDNETHSGADFQGMELGGIVLISVGFFLVMFPNNWPDYITRLLRFVACPTHVDDSSVLSSDASSLSFGIFHSRKMILILLQNEMQTSETRFQLNPRLPCSRLSALKHFVFAQVMGF